jgi:transposase-like protein
MASPLAPTISGFPFGGAVGLFFAADAAGGEARPPTPPSGSGAPVGRPAGKGEPPPEGKGEPPPKGFIGKVRPFLKRHGHKLWWLHSAWALGLGVGVMLLAQKGSEYFRWLALFLGGAWLMFLLFFRIFRSGAQRKVGTGAAKLTFVAMNYIMKDLYQAMLFFLLPFYWKSSTWGSINFWFAVGLAVCALLATLDVVFDNYLMRWRILASVYYLIALFACLNLLVHAVLPSIRVLWGLMAAAGISAFGFITLHIRFRYIATRPGAVMSLVVMAAAMSGAYAGRRVIPPVPYSTVQSVAGTVQLPDGRVADPVRAMAARDFERIVAMTDIASPLGGAEPFRHVWRREGRIVGTVEPQTTRVPGKQVVLRLRSALPPAKIPAERTGSWTVDVETADGQLVGRAVFSVER